MMKMRPFSALAAMIICWQAESLAVAAFDFHQSMINSGGGQHTTAAVGVPISGTMMALIPRFNGGLGTLIQADFEFAGNTNGAWQANPSLSGTIDIGLSGLADVGGQSMGNLVVGFANQPINDQTPIPYGTSNFVSTTFTSGAFFNSLTGVGNETVSWVYSGSSSVSVPAVGAFDWGGTAHALYTYEPVPEPGTLILGTLGALSLLLLRRRQR